MAEESSGIRESETPTSIEPTSQAVPVEAGLRKASERDEEHDPARRPTNPSGPPSKVRERSERHAPVVEARRLLEELGIWVSSPGSEGVDERR